MDFVALYKCLSDPTRLRILNLLSQGPLCVCELQAILEEPQVKMSKHLGYMKQRGILKSTRKSNWSFYEIVPDDNPLLQANLEAIRSLAQNEPILTSDLERLKARSQSGVC